MNQNITPSDLVAYINEEASAELAAAIEHDPDLLAQAEEMKALDMALRAQTPIAGRPTAADEAAYLLGDVSAEKAAWLERFWGDHPYSRSDYNTDPQPAPSSAPILTSILEDAWQSMQARLDIHIAKLLPFQLGLRGQSAEQSSQMTYDVDQYNLKVALSVYTDPDAPKYLEMLCHLNSTSTQWATNVQLDLHHDAQIEPIMQLEGEADDEFVFSKLRAATYTLIIRAEQIEIHIPNINVTS